MRGALSKTAPWKSCLVLNQAGVSNGPMGGVQACLYKGVKAKKMLMQNCVAKVRQSKSCARHQIRIKWPQQKPVRARVE